MGNIEVVTDACAASELSLKLRDAVKPSTKPDAGVPAFSWKST